jgi:hypothetical protein
MAKLDVPIASETVWMSSAAAWRAIPLALQRIGLDAKAAQATRAAVWKLRQRQLRSDETG